LHAAGAVEALIVAAHVGVAEGAAIDGVRSQVGRVAGGVVEGAIVAGLVAAAAHGVVGTGVQAGVVAVAVGDLNQRRSLLAIAGRRRRGRRDRDVGGVMGAASQGKQAGGGQRDRGEGESNTFHRQTHFHSSSFVIRVRERSGCSLR
jgi:hypothetical protein